jgi:poly-beta-hydroxyalkanoate depolymerase
VLVLPGLAGHFGTLVRGTVLTLLPDHDVYLADWHNARDVPPGEGRFGLDEYVEHIFRFLVERSSRDGGLSAVRPGSGRGGGHGRGRRSGAAAERDPDGLRSMRA